MEERYTNGEDVLNFVEYERAEGGRDLVLQHKIRGSVESAHIPLHPDGTVNLRINRRLTDADVYIRKVLASRFAGYTPPPSQALKDFVARVSGAL